VVVLGAIMTILDMTIVNVGLATLGRDFRTSIATIQWVSTVYLLGSVLAGLSWSIGALIAFRVLQGLAGGMLMPLGQTILAQAAGPQRIGRVMSIVGVPMLLAPIFGPVIGGAIVGATSWRWMFLINLPVGALALLLAARLLPVVPRRPWERLDSRGLVVLCGGVAIFVYGLAEIGQRGRLTDAAPPSMLLAGLALVALFVRHALRTAQPLIDVRLFTQRGFATAAATNLVLGVALLLPLYFAQAIPRLTDAFTTTFWVAFALTAVALLPALLLPGSPSSHHPTKLRPAPAQPRPRASDRRSRPALAAQKKGHA
jgi:MFS family permease